MLTLPQIDNIAMIAADTTRSRAYVQALVRNQLIPEYVAILGAHASSKPGQISTQEIGICHDGNDSGLDCWSELEFNPAISITETLEQHGVPHGNIPSDDINSSVTIAAISECEQEIFIYSGFGGAILRKKVLSIGKRFLHVHGGYLPDFKGSTANYYSLLLEGNIGATSIFLNDTIDGGPVLLRKLFPSPKYRDRLDHHYDSAARAKVLVETVKEYLRTGAWHTTIQKNRPGETYYIIHPVLKHLAILS